MNIIEQLNWRYATQKFDPAKTIRASDWNILTESLRLAPSSYGLQPWRFIAVQSQDLRRKLSSASWEQPQIKDCSRFIVFAGLNVLDQTYVNKFIHSIAEQRNIPVSSLESHKQSILKNIVAGSRGSQISQWSQCQCYIAMGFLMHTAALLKIDACPMEGFDPKAYDDILNLTTSHYSTVAAVALGYRHAEDKYQHLKKVRFPESDLFEYK